ncbi:MAG: ATP-dependent DNA helicase [Vicinamibacteraceae bacterium]|nr:ATP-dependent DNA helicase [Vicinamibacteraceae bacterium]
MPGVPALPRADALKSAVARVLAPGGPLASALDGFEPRPAQRRMASAICEVLAEGGVLMAEAGTGTGKTLAYLLPAVLSGHRTLVSTGTKTLQDQILDKDLPLVSRALGRPVKATCMKGRGNYLCLHRYEQFRESPAARALPTRVHVALVDAWLDRTATGDRGEIEDLPEDAPFWGEIAATTENCIGTTCPQYTDCFVTRMRQRAAESDLVIANHHLLCADAAVREHSFGEVIPECPVLVVDEAHQIEDVATQYFGVSVSNLRLDELVRDGRRAFARVDTPGADAALSFEATLTGIEQAARALFTALVARRPGTPARPMRNGGLFDERLRLTREHTFLVDEEAAALVLALGRLEELASALREASDDQRAVGRRAREIHDDLRRILRAGDEDFVYVLELRGRGVFLRALPVDVSAIVRDHLVGRARSAVLTSATLAVGGSFEYARARLGIAEADEILLPSEFDYRSQSVLYLPRTMPDPRTPQFAAAAAAEVTEILHRTDGRAFVLFTSYANLREVHAAVAPRLSYPILVQGEAPRSVLLADFRRTANAVLFATSSFWQGVDVVGEALSCVIIDKLPFASPGDPLVQARMEAIQARGQDPFATYQVPVAILTLLQGLGRLLRHRRDRGVMAVLDPRLRTMGYGRRFLAALPPAPVTHKLDDITAFFAPS